MTEPTESPSVNLARGGLDARERRAWIALASTDGIGRQRIHRLVDHFGGAVALLDAVRGRSAARIQALVRPALGSPLPEKSALALRDSATDPDAIFHRLDQLRVWTMTCFDADYPQALLELESPPPVLYGQGDPGVLDAARRVAVVGTRRPTIGGRAFAAGVARRLVACDAVVFSGLAIGIDGAAHAATVEAGGRTVAVIGGGHSQPGPRAHRSLAGRILDTGGAVIGELAPDDAPRRGTFPLRNRIISVLTQATLVIEAPLRSGALITARHALEQGRSVLVAPGRPIDPSVAGCLALLRETPAQPLVGLDELVVDLGFDVPTAVRSTALRVSVAPLSSQAALGLLGPAERKVAERLLRGPASPDALIADTQLAPAVASGALTLLLLRGWAVAVGPAYGGAGPLGLR